VLLNEFPDGAKVMTLDPILGEKLSPRYEGPYTIVQRNAGGAYILKDGTGTLLDRTYAPSQLKLVLDDADESDTYEVERVVAHRPHTHDSNKKEYLVKWKNYSSKLNTWEPEENFVERSTLTDYWKDKDNISEQPNPLLTNASITELDQENEQSETEEEEALLPPKRKRRRTRARGKNK
jgi:hypothetical protein